MKKRLVEAPAKHLLGISAHTCNAHEANPEQAQIPETLHRYGATALTVDAALYSVYTNYASNEHGDYTYFVGQEEVSNETGEPHVGRALTSLLIPPQTYVVFEVDPGPMPETCIRAWQKIWAMTGDELGGTRAYHTDFERYPPGYIPNQSPFEIYIGIHPR